MKKYYIKRIEEVKNNFTNRKEIFKEIQNIANELHGIYQIALFENDEKKLADIDTLLKDICPLVYYGKQVIPFNMLYQMQSPVFRQMVCSFLYEPSTINKPEEVIEFLKDYTDINYYAETVLICLFYL